MDQLDILEQEGLMTSRFISIHTQAEPDFELHKAVAARGAWIEYDHLGREPDEIVLPQIQRALRAGLTGQLLLSHDLGWFDPAQPGGGTPRPYTHLVDTILPRLRDAGVDEATIVQLTEINPFEAFAR
jgi:phosphotriesterase-related protein